MAKTRKASKQTDAPEKPPRKKPGRKPGCKKIPGSGRQKEVCTWTSPEVRAKMLPVIAQRAIDILEGKPIECSGPTGKSMYRKATILEQIRIIEMAWKKCQPDLAQQTLQGPEGKDLFPKPEEEPDRRALARSVLSILSHADLDQDDNEISVSLPPSAGA